MRSHAHPEGAEDLRLQDVRFWPVLYTRVVGFSDKQFVKEREKLDESDSFGPPVP